MSILQSHIKVNGPSKGHSLEINRKKTQNTDAIRLQKRLDELKMENFALESKREGFQASIADLQQMIVKISNDEDQDLQALRKDNQQMECYKLSLQAGLNAAYQKDKDLRKMLEFWKTYC